MNLGYRREYLGNYPLVQEGNPFSQTSYTGPSNINPSVQVDGIDYISATGSNPTWTLVHDYRMAFKTIVLNNNVNSIVEVQNATGAVCGHFMLTSNSKTADLAYSTNFWTRMNVPSNVNAWFPSQQQGSNFSGSGNMGTSIALSADGNTVAIGSSSFNNGAANDGRVYIAVRNPNTQTWSSQQNISGTASGASSLGTSVSLSGDGNVLVIGAPTFNNGAANDGQVLVYARSGSSWTLSATIDGGAAAGGTHTASERFGRSVSISSGGLVIAIGALNNTAANQGKVFIYTLVSGTWTSALINAGTDLRGAAADRMGTTVALSANGNQLALGLPQAANGIVKLVLNDGAWNTVASGSTVILTSSAGTNNLGSSVAISGDGMVVVAGNPTNEQVNIYKNQNMSVIAQVVYPLGKTLAAPLFGTSVALSPDGNVLVIGAPSETGTGPALTSGATWVYINDGAGYMMPVTKLMGSTITATDTQGTAVAVAVSNTGCTLAVGASGGNKAWVFV